MFLLWVDVCYNEIPGDDTSDSCVCFNFMMLKMPKKATASHHRVAGNKIYTSHFYLMPTNEGFMLNFYG